MNITKSAKEQIGILKEMATEGLESITPNEKLAAAAAVGLVVGGVAATLSQSLRLGTAPAKAAKAPKKPAAS